MKTYLLIAALFCASCGDTKEQELRKEIEKEQEKERITKEMDEGKTFQEAYDDTAAVNQCAKNNFGKSKNAPIFIIETKVKGKDL